MTTTDVIAAAFLPSDGYIDPASVAQALARGARMKGAKIIEGARVTSITVEGKRARRVITDQGEYDCEILVNCAGMWGREIGQMTGTRVPSLALEHQYLVTDPIPDMPKNMPTLRDPDLLVYYKPEVSGIAVGGYEPDTKPFGDHGIPQNLRPGTAAGKFRPFRTARHIGRQTHADLGKGGRAPARQRAHPLFRRCRFHHGEIAGAR